MGSWERQIDFALGKVWGSLAQERILPRTKTFPHAAPFVGATFLQLFTQLIPKSSVKIQEAISAFQQSSNTYWGPTKFWALHVVSSRDTERDMTSIFLYSWSLISNLLLLEAFSHLCRLSEKPTPLNVSIICCVCFSVKAHFSVIICWPVSTVRQKLLKHWDCFISISSGPNPCVWQSQ